MSLFYISLGLVTTTRVTHATPAALYAHTVNRDYECDGEIPQEDTDSKGKFFLKNYFSFWKLFQNIIFFSDIAWQLVHHDPGDKLKVILGGGRPAFLPKNLYERIYHKNDKNIELLAYNYGEDDWDCRRKDGANLISDWLTQKGKLL